MIKNCVKFLTMSEIFKVDGRARKRPSNVRRGVQNERQGVRERAALTNYRECENFNNVRILNGEL